MYPCAHWYHGPLKFDLLAAVKLNEAAMFSCFSFSFFLVARDITYVQ
jgi:hypothetical protein